MNTKKAASAGIIGGEEGTVELVISSHPLWFILMHIRAIVGLGCLTALGVFAVCQYECNNRKGKSV